VKDLLDRCEFDTIYHEHLCYYSLTALDRLARRHGLMAQDVRRVPIHGGSLRVEFGALLLLPWRELIPPPPRGEAGWGPCSRKKRMGVDSVDVYQKFAERVVGVRAELRQLLSGLKAEGQSGCRLRRGGQGPTLPTTPHRTRRWISSSTAAPTSRAASCRAFTSRSFARAAARGDARLRAAADLEFRRRDHVAAGGVSPPQREIIIPIPEPQVV